MPKTRQLHLVISDADLEFLRTLAKERDESIAAIIRRLIRAVRSNSRQRASELSAAGGADV